MAYVSLALSVILINNFVLVRFLGICPFLGVSKKASTAVGMGMAVTFVITMSNALTYLVNNYILVPLGAEFLQTIVFILIIASLVQFVEMFLQKTSPALYNALGIYLPLITTNCCVLAVALLVAAPIAEFGNRIPTFLEAVIYGFCAGLSFTVAILLFSGIRERLAQQKYPKCMEGFPIALISAALLAIAFLGFTGLKF